MSINIEIIKDDTCDKLDVPNTLSVFKEDIFNYGIFHYEIPPDKLSDNNFEYLESKIPAYVGMYEDYIDFDVVGQSIKSKTSGESAKNLSEIVGIAIGLKSAIQIFGLNKKEIENIPISTKQEKRLDYKSTYNGSEIHIETKGTTSKNKVKTMIQDIHAKKVGKNSINHKYGFVTLFDGLNKNNGTKIYVTDPRIEPFENNFRGVYKYIYYYLIYFSFILDNQEYNKLFKTLIYKRSVNKNTIKIDKFDYSFTFRNKKYLGQCFDKRLILNLIQNSMMNDDNIASLFKKLTANYDRNKYFLGLDIEILKNINSRNIKFLDNYILEDIYDTKENYSYIQMSDGVLFIISKNGALPEMEEKFSESEVKRRLAQLYLFERGIPHKCGASCRSKDIEGKPCDILTYREHCHFHR